MANMGIAIIVGLIELGKWVSEEKTQGKAYFAVAYSPDGEMKFYQRSHDKNLLLSQVSKIVQIRKRAYEGDPEAMHSYAAFPEDRSESWKWLCRAANQDYPKAQGLVGHYYRKGLDPIKRNLLKAYVWYKLAESNGFQAGEVTSEYIITEAGPQCCKLIPFSETLANEMTPSEVAEAKRLVAEWKPNSAQCDEWTSPTAN